MRGEREEVDLEAERGEDLDLGTEEGPDLKNTEEDLEAETEDLEVEVLREQL